MILIVDDDPPYRDFAASALVDGGWQVSTAASGEEALDLLARMPAPMLVLLDPDLGAPGGLSLLCAIRTGSSAAAAAPLLAYAADGRLGTLRMHADGFDDILTKPCPPAELLGAARRWQPDGIGVSLDRLEASFGAETIRPMVARFATLVSEASAALDSGAAEMIAHRIAGVAGILGFAGAGKAWLAVSEGDRSAEQDARRETRLALAAIARRAE